MRRYYFLFFTIFLVLVMINHAFALEVKWPVNEQGFYAGQELVYNRITKDGKEEGIFVFGQSRKLIDGLEYYDCVFTTATTEANFLFLVSPSEQALLLKEIDTGEGKIEIVPFATFLDYPLFDGVSWQGAGIKIVGTNIPVPDFGVLPTLTVENVRAEAIASKNLINLSAGLFESLLVRIDYIGSLMNVPMVLIQRVWVSEQNVFLKISFELRFFSKTISIFDMEFVSFPATGLTIKQKALAWGFLKE